MTRSPRATRSRFRTVADKPERSLSQTDNPPPPSPGSSSTTSTVIMDIADIEKAVANCLAGDVFVDRIVSKLADKVRDAVVETLSQSLSDARARVEELSAEVKTLKKKLKEVENRAGDKHDEIEQYQRRNSLRIFGIPEKSKENTDNIIVSLLRDQLGVDVPVERVERTHRVGKPRAPGDNGQPRPRPIIVKFLSYRDRREVFSHKKALKGTGVTIREDLTARRAEILRKAILMYGVKKTWTLDGRIHWEDGDGQRRVATTLTDLEEH